MKLILSRKGFDSSAGGCPNPVFPDGSSLALPIPDPQSPIRYSQIRHQGKSLGPMVSQLTGNPAFSRKGAHLSNHGVGEGDLFLFFALFRAVEKYRARWRSEEPGWCRLKSAARGQEFVLDLDQYPGVMDWLASPGLLD